MRELLIGFGLLALAACGQPKAVVTKDPGTGETGTLSAPDKDGTVRFETAGRGGIFAAGENVAAPKDLPPFVEIYPGLRLQSVITGEAAGSSEGGGVLAGFSADPPETVAAYYRAVIKRRGLRTQLDRSSNGTILLNAGGETEGEGLYLTIAPKDGGSSVGLTYAAKPSQ